MSALTSQGTYAKPFCPARHSNTCLPERDPPVIGRRRDAAAASLPGRPDRGARTRE